MIKTPLVALAALSVLALSAPADAKDQRVRRSCRSAGEADISMSAKLEVRGAGQSARRKFSAEFEAAPGGAFRDGQRILLQVDGVVVKATRLDEITGGDLVADVNFDTKPTEQDADPFPAAFPDNVGRGTVVNFLRGERVVLGCTLR